MKRLPNIICFLFLISISLEMIYPQQTQFLNRAEHKKQVNEVQNILSEVESALREGRVEILSKFLSPHTYFSLSNGKSGYFSSNQAYYVLEDFFRIYQVTSFKFQNIQADENNPYATGIYNFDFKGKRSTAQVYVSLKKTGSSWKITQLTIN